MREYLITNDKKLSENNPLGLIVIFFNPWGFSIKAIINDFEDKLSKFDLDQHESRFYIKLDSFYFGRRSALIKFRLREKFPKSQITDYIIADGEG